MKAVAVFIFLLAPASALGSQDQVSPISKIFDMLADLQSKIIKEGEAAQKTYDQFTEWCEDNSKKIGFEIKTAKAESEDLKAAIEKSTSTISSLSTKIEELVDSISEDEKELKAAEKVRAEEAADFATEEKESIEVLSMLERAIAVLERELKKGSAAMLQYKNAGSVVKALDIMVQGSLLSTADSERLTALVQTSEDAADSEEDDAAGAPAAAAYESKSGGILGVLEDMQEKAEAQLEKARKAEAASLHNFEMVKQSLTGEIENANKELEEAKKGQAAAEEAKSTAEGDLSVTKKELAEDVASLETLHEDCMRGADEFQTETKGRGGELKALATAKKVLKEALALNQQAQQADEDVSLLQTGERARLSRRADQAKFEAVRFVRDLARNVNSVGLAQLASRMASVVKFSASSGADPFKKVKSLITDMISKLEAEAKKEASHKAYCDKETADSNAKKDEKKALVSKLSTKIESMTAKSAKLKEEVANLQKELAERASSQAEMNKIREEENALYTKNKAELQKGVKGVKKALKVLKDYYAKAKDASGADGSGNAIISMLEIVESDFTKGLSDLEASESSAVDEYEKFTEENKMAIAIKKKDVKYISKEAASLAKGASEMSSDLESTQAELDAIMEYIGKLAEKCVAKAEPYEEKVARRKQEIAGLKEALTILEGETGFVQRVSRHTARGPQ